MKKFFLFLVFFTLLFTILPFGNNYKELHFSFDNPVLSKAENGYINVSLKNCIPVGNPGNPALPVYPAKILIPYGYTLSNYSISFGGKNVVGKNIKVNYIPYPIPTGGNFTTYDNGPNYKIYSSNLPYPTTKSYYSGSGFFKGYLIEMINICPFQYIPSEGKLIFYKKAILKLYLNKTKSTPEGYKLLRDSNFDENEVASIVKNPEDVISYKGHGKKIVDDWEYLIITNSDMQSAFQTLADHKHSVYGLNTHIELISNITSSYSGADDAEKLRNFIKDGYQNHGTKWVVLGGDSEVVPYRGCYGRVETNPATEDNDIPTDFYFAALDGNWNANGNSVYGEPDDDVDLFAEVNVGRISASNSTEATNQINKIIEYENWDDAPFKALLIGEKLDDYTWGGDNKDYVYEMMAGVPCDKLYDRDGTWSGTTLINNYFNSDNLNIVNHLGHANDTYDMKIYNSDIDDITNTKPFFVYSQGCYPGNFTANDLCFAEKFTVGTTHAGFAVIMNSRYGWYARSSVLGTSNVFDREFMKALFEEFHKNVGEALSESRHALSNFVSQEGSYRWVYYEMTLFGCPQTPFHWNCTDSDVSLEKDTPVDDFTYMSGDDITIKVRAHTNCANEIQNPSITAQITTGDAKATTTVDLKDDGVAPDEKAGDGLFSGTWTTSGYGDTTITVTGTGDYLNQGEITINGQVVDSMSYTMPGCDYNFIDISDGTEILNNTDDGGEVVSIGFPFRFYGKDYENVLVSSNGLLRFTNAYEYDAINTDIPDSSSPNGLIAIYWSDMYVNSDSHVYYKTIGDAPNRKFIVEYYNLAHYENVYGGTFEVILEESTNKIYFEYKDVTFDSSDYSNGKEATIGIEDYNGLHGVKYSYNTASIVDETAVCFDPIGNYPFLTKYGNTKIIGGGDGDDVALPGETVEIRVNLYNPSTTTDKNVNVQLIADGNCTINSGAQDIGDIAPGETAFTTFAITADSSANCGDYMDFTVRVSYEDGSGNTYINHFPAHHIIGRYVENIFFEDDFESGTSRWTTQLASGNEDWALSSSEYNSSSHSYFSSDEENIKDDYLISDLFSVEDGTLLEFYHYYVLESGFDGGVLEIQEEGSTNWVDAENLIIENGYTKSISTSYDSPIAGRNAWSGDSGGFIKSVVDLSSYAGKNIRIRFRLACDKSVGKTGWYIDDVVVYHSYYDCSVVPTGDVNGDGYVDAVDLSIMLNVVNGNISEGTSPCTSPSYGDFNSNGHIDIDDCVYLANILSGNQ